MNFRNIMFLISITIIGFCFTLYFQSDVDIKSINLDQYKDLNYSKTPSISLTEFNEKIAPLKLENLIQEIYQQNKALGERTRIMEINPGNGRILMELKKTFPDIEFYGINREKTMTFYRRESFILTALKFEIFSKEEIEDIELPYVLFQDLDFGSRIPYGDNKFDLIFSHSFVSSIKYKFELFNEILRVLKKKGVSIHTDIPPFNIYAKGVVLDLRDALKAIRKRGVEIYQLDGQNTLLFKKSDQGTPFPVTPHQSIPESIDNLSTEQRRPEMGYNLSN